MIYLGHLEQKKLYAAISKVDDVYIGSNHIWTADVITYEYELKADVSIIEVSAISSYEKKVFHITSNKKKYINGVLTETTILPIYFSDDNPPKPSWIQNFSIIDNNVEITNTMSYEAEDRYFHFGVTNGNDSLSLTFGQYAAEYAYAYFIQSETPIVFETGGNTVQVVRAYGRKQVFINGEHFGEEKADTDVINLNEDLFYIEKRFSEGSYDYYSLETVRENHSGNDITGTIVFYCVGDETKKVYVDIIQQSS